MKLILTFLLAVFTVTFSLGQCTVSIDLVENIILCQSGSTTVLMPTIQGNFTSFEWSPSSGLSDINSLTPTTTVVANIDYTLSVNSISETELISNGDFSLGNTDFTSDYIPGTGGGVGLLSNEGQFAIVDNAGDTHNQFANCSDHTGNGNMMVINASGDASNLWCQSIVVAANTNYSFSAWVASVTSQNPAQLQFSVNGIQLGTPFNASSNTCNWQQFSSEWFSDATTTAEICIANTNFTPAGNDFALDDISFREICNTEAIVNIQIADINTDIAVPSEICEGSGMINLSVFLSNGTSIGGTWLLDGASITLFNTNAISVGPHSLEYTVTQGSCTDSGLANFELIQAPTAGSASDLNGCVDAIFPINLFDQLSGNGSDGTWSLLSGPNTGILNSISGNFMGSAPGEYVFQYLISGNGLCPDDQVNITVIAAANPTVDLDEAPFIDCITPSITLGGGNTSTNGNYQYNWLQDGTPISNNTSLLLVNQAGDYQLEVIDLNSSCAATANSTVSSLINEIDFTADITVAPCSTPNEGLIIINPPTGGTAPYLVSIDGINFVLNDSFPNLPPFDYTIIVQDAGGCEASQNANLPAPSMPDLIIQASTNDPVPLGETFNLLVISNPVIEALDTFFWTPNIDSLRVSTKQWLIQATQTTEYTLVVMDANGCTAEASVLVQVIPEGNVYIPNIFSPNEDGHNDRFLFHDNGAISNITQLQIFNRWGVQVYAEKDLKANSNDRMWDGKFNGDKLPQGVYIYSAQILWINGETGQLQGEISIVY